KHLRRIAEAAWPIGIAFKMRAPELVRPRTGRKRYERLNDLLSDRGKARRELLRLLALRNAPACRLVIRKHLRQGPRAIGLLADPGCGHEFGIGGDRIASFATRPVPILDQLAPAALHACTLK